ncbi:MAG: hypothetical protein ACI9FN_003580 [Saprospiraceae bacterium]|jgi:hypothetical protein
MRNYITPQEINLPEYEGFLQDEPQKNHLIPSIQNQLA